MQDEKLAYRDYWRKKAILTEPPHAPVVRWWRSEGLSEVEQIIFDAVKRQPSVLDVGAGDLTFRKKIKAAGYRGEYETQDISTEFDHDYTGLPQIRKRFGAILCLDVLEHQTLNDGLRMLEQLVAMLADDGVLVIQTPNARCIRNPLATDMTHLHCYNLSDLWAYLTTAGLHVTGYRVVFGPRRRSLWGSLHFLLSAFVITKLLGCDYAENILLLARKA